MKATEMAGSVVLPGVRLCQSDDIHMQGGFYISCALLIFTIIVIIHNCQDMAPTHNMVTFTPV